MHFECRDLDSTTMYTKLSIVDSTTFFKLTRHFPRHEGERGGFLPGSSPFPTQSQPHIATPFESENKIIKMELPTKDEIIKNKMELPTKDPWTKLQYSCVLYSIHFALLIVNIIQWCYFNNNTLLQL